MDEEEEVTVESPDPAIRKLARKMLMQKRAEFIESNEAPKDLNVPQTMEIEDRILSSLNYLNMSLEETGEVISNVRIANDARELVRRRNMQRMKQSLSAKLQENAEKCAEKYKLVESNWTTILSTIDVIDLNDELERQNERCQEVLAMKNKIIAELKQQLEDSDAKFVAEQIKQNQEIDLLIDRIDNQVIVTSKAYAQQLSQINQDFERKRKDLIEMTCYKWNALLKQFEQNNLNGVELRSEIVRQCEADMEKMIIKHHEDYREWKMNLEMEHQALQRQLEYTKSLCLLNTEKLNYNYDILKRRENENMIIKNYQRKKFNKLHNGIAYYKQMVASTKQSIQTEKQQAAEQITRIRNKIVEMDAKANRLAKANDERYFSIWEMNTARANELLEKILQIDKVIYDEILGLEWKPPLLKLLNKEDLPSYCLAKSTLEKKQQEIEEKIKAFELTDAPIDLNEMNLERRFLNKLFHLLSDKSDIYTEERLKSLLEMYSERNNIIIKLDSVFKALNIVSEKEVRSLMKVFLPYLYCATCAKIQEEEADKSLSSSTTSTEIYESCQEKKLVLAVQDVLNNTKFCTKEEIDPCEEELNRTLPCNFAKEEVTTVDTKPPDTLSQKLLCKEGHLLDIKMTHVIALFKEFVKNHAEIKDTVRNLIQELMERKCTISRNVSAEDVTNYWARYRALFPQRCEDLWNALLVGMNKYLDILKERRKIQQDIEKLKRRNSELKHLLHSYDIQLDLEDN